MKLWTIKGVTDTVDTCDCCGRKDLKRTVWMVHENGGEVFFGTECAAQALELPAKDVQKQARTAQQAADRLKAAARRRQADAEMGAWVGFLVRETGTANILDACAKLGGFAAARAKFKAGGGA